MKSMDGERKLSSNYYEIYFNLKLLKYEAGDYVVGEYGDDKDED